MVGMIVNNLLYYFDLVYALPYLLDFILGNSVTTSLLLYICSYTFGFCNWHRLMITSNLVNILIASIDKMYRIPVSDMELLLIYPSVYLIFITIAIYNKFVYNNEKCHKNTRK